MPTLSSDDAGRPSTAPRPIHQAREVAESFGLDAERYNRARSSYPGALIKRIAAASPGRAVLDVGCGTGIASRQFQAAGCQVLGIDPDQQMGAFAQEHGTDVEIAKFEDWDPRGRKFDAVVAGMTWHWIDPATGPAKAAQVLRPGGRLALFWYVSEAAPALREAFAEAYRRVLPPDSPFARGTMPGLDAYSAIFTKADEGIRRSGAFTDPEPWQQWRYDWDRTFTRDEWLDAVPTSGGHTRFPPDVLNELLTQIGAAIDASGGSFTVLYTAAAVSATRTSADAGHNPP